LIPIDSKKNRKLMENRKENCGEKRRRKMIARPVLVRSEKPGQVASASYIRQRNSPSLWKAA
jgi:predicted metalloprotease